MINHKDIYIAHQRSSDNEIQTLETHLFGVSVLAKQFASQINLESSGELIGLLHDFGKYSIEFQNYIKSATGIINFDEDDYVDYKAKKGRIHHSTAGAQYIWNELSKTSTICAQILSLCIASHHSGLIDCFNVDGENTYLRRTSTDDAVSHLHESTQKCDKDILGKANALIKNISIELNKAIALIEKYKKPDEDDLVVFFKIGLLIRNLFSCLIDADRLDTARFENPSIMGIRQNKLPADWSMLATRFEKHIEKLKLNSNKKNNTEINNIRNQISNHCLERSTDKKGLFTLTVPTGGGKTLASLRFALHHAKCHNLSRVIYILPFTSIIDQNAQVARDILEPEDERGLVVLEHHSNLTDDKQNWKSKILSENWDAPIIFTSNVKFLEALFAGGTRDARRMHQLNNSLIIFDEAQTIPVNCIHLFCNAINYLVDHCGSSVILSTATQPTFGDLRNKRNGYLKISSKNEIIPDVSKLFSDLRRVDIFDETKKIGGWVDEDIIELAISESNELKSCLIICNTKKSARSIFQKCKIKTNINIYHLSTSMCSAHRMKILNEIKENLEKIPLICISTQLIEAGVDIDFGSVIRCSAGLDSVAQAAGRCNRHAERKVGRVYIVNPKDENLKNLIDIKIGKEKTEKVLLDFSQNQNYFGNDLLHPKALSQYFHYYFHERAPNMEYEISALDLGRDDTILNLLSKNNKIKINGGYLPYSFKTASRHFKAINSQTRGIVVPYEKGAELIVKLCSANNMQVLMAELKRAQRYSVNVFEYQFKKLADEKIIQEVQEGTGIYYLSDSRYYNINYGLDEISSELFEVLHAG